MNDGCGTWKRGARECLRVVSLEAGECAACSSRCHVYVRNALEMLLYTFEEGLGRALLPSPHQESIAEGCSFCDSSSLRTCE